MSDVANEGEPAYHLLLEPEEAAITRQALRLLISDEAHEALLRSLARQVIELLETSPTGGQQVDGEDRPSSATLITVPLTPPQMKITHTAVKLLLDDTQREQGTERRLLWSILDKLPDEHAIRAIALDSASPGRT